MVIAFLAKANAASAHPPIQFPGQGDLLAWCQEMGVGTGILITLLGAVYLMYGWSIFKYLVTINAAVVGAYIGVLAGNKLGSPLVGGAAGALIASGVTWPLMKWAVAVMGGICGALVGASIWKMAGQDPQYAWAGAMTGLVGFGLFSFILFRGSLIIYTSIQGAMMVIVGMIGLAFKYPDFATKIAQSMGSQPMLLPVSIIVPMILGLIYQQTHSAPAGGGGGGDGGEKSEKKK